MRPEMESRLPLSKHQRRTLNRALAAELRTYGLTPNGEVWEEAKAIMATGLTPKQAARLTRSIQPDEVQRDAIAKARAQGANSRPAKAEVVQVPTFSEQLALEVEREAADLDSEPERTVVLSSRAIDVREGRVRRDAKGRLLPA